MIIQTRWRINSLQSFAYWDLQTGTHADIDKHIVFSHKHTVGPLLIFNGKPRQIIKVCQKDIARAQTQKKKGEICMK